MSADLTMRIRYAVILLPGMLAIPFAGKVPDYAINRRVWNRLLE